MTGVPAISVVMPVFNGGQFLTTSVDSILAQSERDFELIVIDDGSTDGSATVLRDYAARDDRVRVIDQPHLGIVAALNRAQRAVRAPLIARMDADDLAHPDRLARQREALADNPDVAVLGSAVTLIDDQDRVVGQCRYPIRPDRVERSLRIGINALAHPAVMMRTAVLAEVGGYDPRFSHSEDFELWLRIARRFAIANLPEPLLSHRLHSDSVGSRHRIDQIVAGRIAVAVDRAARHGRTDPVAGLARLGPADFDRVDFLPAEIAQVKLDVGEVLLESMRRGRADPGAEALGRRLLRPADPATPTELVAALFRGGGRGYRSARKAESLALYFFRSGDRRASVTWLARSLWRYPWGAFALAFRALRRLWTPVLQTVD